MLDELPAWRDGPLLVDLGGHQVPMMLTNTGKTSSDGYLLVVFNGAVRNRAESSPPFYSGAGLARSYPGPVLSISDPGTHYNEVNLAWYAGLTGFETLQKELAAFIHRLSKNHGIKPFLLGSSGGGFASLCLAWLIGEDATALAMNPQTDFFRYFPSPVARYLQVCYGLPRTPEAQQDLEERGVITNVQGLDFTKPRVLVLQNMFDAHHLAHHFRFLSASGVLQHGTTGHDHGIDWMVAPWGFGHQRVWPEHVQLVINAVHDGLTNSEVLRLLQQQFYPEGTAIEPMTRLVSEKAVETKFPMLVKSDGSTLNIGTHDFDKEDVITEEIHGWGIIRPLLAGGSLGPDLYRALYFILHWAKWSQGNVQLPPPPSHLIQQRVEILHWLLPLMEETGGLMPHASSIKALLEFELSQLPKT